MTDILSRIVADKHQEVAQLMQSHPLPQVQAQAQSLGTVRPFTAALKASRPRGSGSEVNIIAEIKLKSPSKGVFAWHGDVARQVAAYETGGAKAISVVTDGKYFGGSTDLLRQVKSRTRLPVMQKEFVVHPYQIHYARALGADAVLLIAAVLQGNALADMVALARQVGIGTLVEVVDEAEMQRAVAAEAEVVGVNNRDLRTFTLDHDRAARLLPLCGEERVFITESGVKTRADVERMLALGVDGFLIGEALMTAPDAAHTLALLRGNLTEVAS